MAKILHMADVHLGAPFATLGDTKKAAMMRQSVMDTFHRAMVYGAENGADLIIIAGDLFDNGFVGNKILREAEKAFEAAGNVPIVITPGNHDCMSGGLYDAANFPKNVFVFRSEEQRIKIDALKMCIYGRAYVAESKRERALEENITMRFAATDDGDISDYLHIAIVHGDVTESDSPYNPVSVRDIRDCGADYVALGHIHKPSGVLKAGKVPYAYSGCLCGHGFDETDERGFMFGEITKDKCAMEFIPFAERQYKIAEVDITSAQSMDDVYSAVDKAVADIADNSLVRVVLTGSVEPTLRIIDELVLERLGRFIHAELVEETKPVKNIDDYKKQKNLTGIFTRGILEKAEQADEADRKIYEDALRYGLAALSGERVVFDED